MNSVNATIARVQNNSCTRVACVPPDPATLYTLVLQSLLLRRSLALAATPKYSKPSHPEHDEEATRKESGLLQGRASQSHPSRLEATYSARVRRDPNTVRAAAEIPKHTLPWADGPIHCRVRERLVAPDSTFLEGRQGSRSMHVRMLHKSSCNSDRSSFIDSSFSVSLSSFVETVKNRANKT